MTTVSAPVDSVIQELEQLIEAIRQGKVKCSSFHRMTTLEKKFDMLGEIGYIKTESVDLSFTKEVS